MSLTYPITLNQVFVHPLAYPENGVCEIENNSQYYLYVAVGQWSKVSDVQSNNVAVIPPYQKRAFKANIHNQTPSITLAPTNTPFAFTGTIANSPNVVRVSEYSDPKAYYPSQGFEGLAADYIIIAGGRVQANQFGLFANDTDNFPAFAVIGQPTTWDGAAVKQGDIVIGRYFSMGKGLWWESANDELHVKGNIIVDGGNTITVVGVKGTFTVTDYKTVSWTAVTIFLSDNSTRAITDSSISQVGTTYLQVSIDPVISPTVIIPGTSPAGYPFVTIGLLIANPVTTEKGTIFLTNGATDIGADRISVQKLSALTADLGSITAGVVTGATIQTAASGERMVLNSVNLTRYVSASNVAVDLWYDLATGLLASDIIGHYSAGAGLLNLDAYIQQNIAGAVASLTLAAHDLTPHSTGLYVAQIKGDVNSEIRVTVGGSVLLDVLETALNVYQLVYGLAAGTNTHTFYGNLTLSAFARLDRLIVGAGFSDPGSNNAIVAGQLIVVGKLQANAWGQINRLSVGNVADPTTAGQLALGDRIVSSLACGARAFNSGNITLSNTTWTVVTLDSTRWDTENNHSGVGSNARLYAQRGGKYLITFTGEFVGNATGVRRAHVRMNSGESIAGGTGINLVSSPNAGTFPVDLNLSCVQDMAFGDYVEVFVWQNSGGNLDLVSVSAYSPDLSIVRIA